jgi:iron complex outermembrane receptor protein
VRHALAAVLALAPATAWTDAAAAAEAADEPSAQLEELVVTAQKREEKLQDVPIAVTAVTAQALAAANVTTTLDLPTLVPGFVAQQRTGSFVPFLRGVGSLDPNPQNESIVSTYIDGVYILNLYAGLMALNNVERLEVLKGPQGTLFGRNSVGGVINIVTKTPSTTTQGNFEVGYGNYDTHTAKGYLTGQIAPRLTADVALAYQKQNRDWGKSIATGNGYGSIDYFGLRGKLHLDLSDTQITLAADYGTTDSDSSVAFSPYTPGQILPFGGGPFTGGFYDNNSRFPTYINVRQEGLSLRIEHDLGFARLTSISSYRNTKSNRATNQLNGLVGFESTFSDDYTQEFQLASPDDSKIKWIAGVFYLDHTISPHSRSRLQVPPLNPLTGIAARVYGYTTKSLAGYAQTTVPIGFDTNLTAGIRYSTDEQGIFRTDYNSFGTVLATYPSPTFPDTDRTYKKWTYRAALDHKFSEDILGYVSFNRGYKAGVWNALLAIPSTTEPEILDAFEAGLKTESFDRRLRVNAAAFAYDYKNIQFNLILPAGIFLLQNAGEAKLQGLDIDAVAVPTANLRISAGASYVWKHEYSAFPSGAVFVPNGSAVTGGTGGAGATIVNGPNGTRIITCPPSGGAPAINCLFNGSFKGKNTLLAPTFSGNLGADYTVPMEAGDLNLNVTVSYTSKIYRLIDNSLSEPGYALVNASARWTPGNNGLTITAWGKNLNDHKYHTFGAALNFGYVGAPAPPRTYGMTVGYKF